MNARSILLAVSSSCSDALDGSVFASLPFDRETIEWLDQRARFFIKAREAYPCLYETYEFDSRLQWYDTSADKEYADQADRDKLARLTDDVDPFVDDDRQAELGKLENHSGLVDGSQERNGPGVNARERGLKLHGNRALVLSKLQRHAESAKEWARVEELSTELLPDNYRVRLVIELLQVRELTRVGLTRALAQAEFLKPNKDIAGEDRYNLGRLYARCTSSA